MKNTHTRLVPFYVSLAIVLGVLLGSFYTRRFSGGQISFIKTSNNKLNDLLHLIDDQYVDTVDMNDLVERSLSQVLKELDPHSVYISAKDAEASMQELKGSFSGIGIQFMIHADTIRVVRVVEGGPSEGVGLRAGDRIVRIDGQTYVGKALNNDSVMKRLKGEKNSSVRLGIRRLGQAKELTFNIMRGDIPLKSVDAAYMLNDQTGYLRITTWGDNTYAELLRALAILNGEGMESLVIDLRGNLGGYLQAATQVANEFLHKGASIVQAKGRNFPQEEYKSNGKGAFQQLPLVVLIDESSASASEIFAGAMQDHDRAAIVGRRSFGKGLVQVPITFRDGSVVRLTRARYYTPSGRCVQKSYTPGDEKSYEADLFDRALSGEYYHPDSIKTGGKQYKTKKGRIVYADGGIIPDYFIARDTTGITSYYRDVFLSGTLQQYAYSYTDLHRKQLENMTTQEQLLRHLNKKNLVEDFVNYAEKHGVKRRNLMIKTSYKLLQERIFSNIISDVMGNEQAIVYINATDPAILKALQLIKEKRTYPTVEEQQALQRKKAAQKK